MIVFVDDNRTEVHTGARVRDAILKHDHFLITLMAKGEFIIKDRFGNEQSPDGALTENEHIYIIHRDKK